jgi:hypothetical protein
VLEDDLVAMRLHVTRSASTWEEKERSVYTVEQLQKELDQFYRLKADGVDHKEGNGTASP